MVGTTSSTTTSSSAVRDQIVGIDVGYRNFCLCYSHADNVTHEIHKIDLFSQLNIESGQFEQIEYEERHARTLVKYVVSQLWETHFSRVKYAGIEDQRMRRYIIFAWLLYEELTSNGIVCFMIFPRSVRNWYGTSVATTKNEEEDYRKRKQKGMEAVKKRWGTDLFDKVKQVFDCKMDDIADAFMLARYTRHFLPTLLKKKYAPFNFQKKIQKQKKNSGGGQTRKKKPQKRFQSIVLQFNNPENLDPEAPPRKRIKKE